MHTHTDLLSHLRDPGARLVPTYPSTISLRLSPFPCISRLMELASVEDKTVKTIVI